MSTALTQVVQQPAGLTIAETRMSVAQLIEQRKAIVEVMEKTMTKEIDYGIIPGTPKPTLYKPGSEKILAIFHLGVRPRIEDLSTPDCIRYRVHLEIFHQPTGNTLGEGVGEASSAEAKYQWRAAVCDEEWRATPDDRKREKWKKGGPQGPYSIQQVRADMDDVANTILKMAKKRAQIDAVLTATAASDIFAQDLEDLKEAGLDPAEMVTPSSVTPPPAQQQPAQQQELHRREPAPATQQRTAPPAATGRPSAATITPEQGKRFWAIAMGRVNDYKAIQDYLKSVHGVGRKDDIMATRYEEAVKWAESGVVE
jgi:hypothetical protein